MRYIESPNTTLVSENEVSVFLAGGITGCPDWQTELRKTLGGVPGLVLFNPRRSDFPIHDPEAAPAQIKWEFEHLRIADIILFWFPKEGVQAIVMYELGAWSMTDKKLVIGVEPGFWREQDVYEQTRLIRPDQKIFSSLFDLSDGLVNDL